MIRQILTLIIILLFCNSTQAGWVITETNTSSDDVVLQTIYMQDNLIKIPGIQETMIMDLNNGVLTFILENHKAYWRGNIHEFRQGMALTLEKQLSLILPQIQEEERATFEQNYRHQLDIYKNDSSEKVFLGDVICTETNKTATIQGYATKKYDIFVDSLLVEEIWLTKDIYPFAEIDYASFSRMQDGITLSGKIEFNRSPEYIEVLLSGYPLQSKKHTGEETIHTLVTSISEVDLPASTFEPPSNFRQMTLNALMELIMGN
jgi:hypothetical protein